MKTKTLRLIVFVFAYDLVRAIQVPAVLVAAHGLEVLADAFVYARVLVSRLWPPSDTADSVQAREDEAMV